jgi:hypothetical protein
VVGASPLGRARTGVRRVRAVRVAAVNFILMVGFGVCSWEAVCVAGLVWMLMLMVLERMVKREERQVSLYFSRCPQMCLRRCDM